MSVEVTSTKTDAPAPSQQPRRQRLPRAFPFSSSRRNRRSSSNKGRTSTTATAGAEQEPGGGGSTCSRTRAAAPPSSSLSFLRRRPGRRNHGRRKLGDSGAASSSTAAASSSCSSSSSSLADNGNSRGLALSREHLQSLSEELRGLESFHFEDDDEPSHHLPAVDCLRFQGLVLGILLAPHRQQQPQKQPPPPEAQASSWRKTARILAAKPDVAAAMNHDYTEVLLDQVRREGEEGTAPSASASSSSLPDLGMHLVAAGHLLQEFVNIVRAVTASPPASGRGTAFLLDSVLETILGQALDFLRPRLAHLYYDCHDGEAATSPAAPVPGRDAALLRPDCTPRDAARVVAWIDSWLHALQNLPFSDAAPGGCPHGGRWLVEDRDRLLDLYLDRAVVREVRALRGRLQLRSVLEAEDDVLRKGPDGAMATTVPEQVSFMVDSQLAVARECLVSPDHVDRVLEACHAELGLLVGDWMLAIGSDWKSIPARWFCAIVNDSARMADLCEERSARHRRGGGRTGSQASPPRGGDDDDDGAAVVREFLELGSHAVRYLCEHIVFGLCDPDRPILSSVGGREWESDGAQSALERTIATFDDYLADLESWLSGSYWLPKVLKHCFDLTLQVYVESFFSNTLAGGVKDPARAANELNEDYLRLVIFFNSDRFERFHDAGGYYTQRAVNSRLHVIRCLATLVDPGVEPDDASGEARFLLAELRGDASAVLHLAGLRKRHSPFERVEWLRVVSKAKRSAVGRPSKVGGIVAERAAAAYRLPDLRNSPYLSKVRPNARDVRRRLSTESLALAQSTSRILKISLVGDGKAR